MTHATLRSFSFRKGFGGVGVKRHEEIYLWISECRKKSLQGVTVSAPSVLTQMRSQDGCRVTAAFGVCVVTLLSLSSTQLTLTENGPDESHCGKSSASHKDRYIQSPRVWSVVHKQYFIFKN